MLRSVWRRLCRPSVLPGHAAGDRGGHARPARLDAHPPRPSGRSSCFRILLVLSPWMIRNFLVFGEPIWTTTHGGYTLALANNPVYYRDVLNGPPGRVWTGHDQWLWADSVTRETAGMSEPDADRYMRNQALQLAREQPGDFARATLARLGHFWAVAPVASVYPTGGSNRDSGLDHPSLSRACDRALSAGRLVLAAGGGTPGHSGAHDRPRVLLD